MRLPKGMAVVTHNGYTIVKLYQTNILVINHNENVLTLDVGNWYTMHSKKCLNLMLARYDIYVSQKNHQWFVYQNDKKMPYVNGMTLSF